jgi:acetylornithine/LysW-gamma-L-lysine aminotransferase
MSGFVFSEKPIEIVRGDGPYVYGADGTEYLDFGASYACVPVGHGHDRVTDAVTTQLADLTYVQASYPVAARTALYEQLANLAPGDLGKVWLCNSGTEANEAAMKFARSATGRKKIVATKRGFHGRTMGALAMTWKKKYRAPFEPLAGGIEFVDYGDEGGLREAVDDETAAVFLEPVQGEGGIRPAPPGYLRAAREVTDEAGAALVFDEVQTGVGRTGLMWASQRAGVVPDVLTTAKGVANGLPLGATLCRDWVAAESGDHGSTFSGGPVVCAAASATLSTIEEKDLAANANRVGAYLVQELRKADVDAREVRGLGLMVGVEVKRGANRLLRDLALEHDVLALPAGRTVVRFLPPLTVGREHVDEVVAAMEAVT